MKRITPFLIPILILIVACSDNGKLAGGYDDVENPALTLSLKDPQGKPYGAGGSEVKVYARFQNPVLDTVPVLTLAPSGAGTVRLDDTVLVAAMRLARARGIPWPTTDTVEFNIVGSAPTAEAYSGNFVLSKSAGTVYGFRQRVDAATVLQADRKGTLSVTLSMGAPILGFHGSIGTRGMDLGLKSLFIPGSPYFAQIASDGSFTLARLGSGKYEVKAMSDDGKVYSAADTLNTDRIDSGYTASEWSEADIIWVKQ
jgi:hypothetical protein